MRKKIIEFSTLLLFYTLTISIVLPAGLPLTINSSTLRQKSTSLSTDAKEEIGDVLKTSSSGDRDDKQPQPPRPQERGLGDEFIVKRITLEDDVLVAVTQADSHYRLALEEGGKVKEEFHLAGGTDKRRAGSIRANIFRTLLTNPASKTGEFLLTHSQEHIAMYIVPRIEGLESAGNYRRAAALSAIASGRFLKEGDMVRAVERVNRAVADLKLDIDKTDQPSKAVMNALLLKKEAELHEMLKIHKHLEIAARRWEKAGEAYSKLAETAKSKKERNSYLRESAMCIENGAKLHARILNLLDPDKVEKSKVHIANKFRCAAIKWFHAGRFEDALGCLNESIVLNRYLKNIKGEIMDLALMARCNLELNKREETLACAVSAIKLSRDMLRTGNLSTFEELERKKGIVKEWWLISDCYFRRGDPKKAVRFAKTALRVLYKNGLHTIWDGAKRYEGDLRRFIVYSYFKLKQYDVCCKEAGKAFSLLISMDNKSVAADILSLKGRASVLSGKYIDAYESYENSAMLHEEVGALEYASKDWANAAATHVGLAKSGITPGEHYIKAGYCDRRSAELAKEEGRVDMAIQHYLFACRNFSFGHEKIGSRNCWNMAFRLTKGLIVDALRTNAGFNALAYLRRDHNEIFDVEIEDLIIRLIEKVSGSLLKQVSVDRVNKELEAIDSAA